LRNRSDGNFKLVTDHLETWNFYRSYTCMLFTFLEALYCQSHVHYCKYIT